MSNPADDLVALWPGAVRLWARMASAWFDAVTDFAIDVYDAMVPSETDITDLVNAVTVYAPPQNASLQIVPGVFTHSSGATIQPADLSIKPATLPAGTEYTAVVLSCSKVTANTPDGDYQGTINDLAGNAVVTDVSLYIAGQLVPA